MKELTILLDDDEYIKVQEAMEKEGGSSSIEQYIYTTLFMHIDTMEAMRDLMKGVDLEDLSQLSNMMPSNVIHMPITLNSIEDQEEFKDYLTNALNEAVSNYENDKNKNIN